LARGRSSRGAARLGVARGALALGSVVVAGAVFAGAVTTTVARRIVTPPSRRPEDTPVLGVDRPAGRIRFGVTDDALLPGRYSFWFDQGRGHARIGEVVHRGTAEVERELLGVDFGDIAQAKQGRFNGWVFLSPSELATGGTSTDAATPVEAVPFENVRLQTTLGAAPAWLVPAATATDKWVILVHGRATVRQEVLRAVPVFREAGYSSLLISYRNDGEAPPSADNRYSLGDTEWLDVESAILLALDRGATEILLMGWSMGGAIVLQTVTRSAVASVISGVVLESPVISWTETLRYQGRSLGLPPPVERGVLSMLTSRWGGVLTGKDEPIDLGRLDFVARAADLRVPILILHSDDDGYVPSGGSRALAAARPDIVRLVPFAVARHTKLWNYDSERWEGAIRAWLRNDDATLGVLAGDTERSARRVRSDPDRRRHGRKHPVDGSPSRRRKKSA
jgi:uncharacterized protein